MRLIVMAEVDSMFGPREALSHAGPCDAHSCCIAPLQESGETSAAVFDGVSTLSCVFVIVGAMKPLSELVPESLMNVSCLTLGRKMFSG